jgi:hypothetical protein
VIETSKRILVLGLLGAAVALLTAAPAAAESCGQKVVDDWWAHGTVKGTYPVDCYRDALKLLPDDASTYSSAPDEIRRALAVAVQRQRQTPPPPAAVANPPPSPPAPAATSDDGGGSGGSGSGAEGSGGSTEKSGSGGNGSRQTTGPSSSSSEKEQTTTEASGGGPITTDSGGGSGGGSGNSGGGSAQGVLDKIGPDSADGLPLPLLIVAGLALLLLAAGSAGLITRRVQARKARPPVVPPRQPRS